MYLMLLYGTYYENKLLKPQNHTEQSVWCYNLVNYV